MVMRIILSYRSMVESAKRNTSTHIKDEEIDKMVTQMFNLAGMEGKSSLKFEEFKKLFNKHMDLLWDVSLDWKGWLVIYICSNKN